MVRRNHRIAERGKTSSYREEERRAENIIIHKKVIPKNIWCDNKMCYEIFIPPPNSPPAIPRME